MKMLTKITLIVLFSNVFFFEILLYSDDSSMNWASFMSRNPPGLTVTENSPDQVHNKYRGKVDGIDDPALYDDDDTSKFLVRDRLREWYRSGGNKKAIYNEQIKNSILRNLAYMTLQAKKVLSTCNELSGLLNKARQDFKGRLRNGINFNFSDELNGASGTAWSDTIILDTK